MLPRAKLRISLDSRDIMHTIDIFLCKITTLKFDLQLPDHDLTWPDLDQNGKMIITDDLEMKNNP